MRGLGVLVIRPAVQSLPREPPLVGLRGGRLSPQADLSYKPSSPRETRREASALGAEPQRAPSHTPHAASGWSGIASESPRPARVFRERSGSEGHCFLVSRHADACTAVQKLSSRWNGCAPAPHRAERVVDVGAEEGGVAKGRVVVGHAGGGVVGEQQGGEMPERAGREA